MYMKDSEVKTIMKKQTFRQTKFELSFYEDVIMRPGVIFCRLVNLFKALKFSKA